MQTSEVIKKGPRRLGRSQNMRSTIILATFMVMGFTAVSPSVAHAEQYCGFINKPGAIVKCGYSSRASCEKMIGRDARCFVDPDVARMDR